MYWKGGFLVWRPARTTPWHSWGTCCTSTWYWSPDFCPHHANLLAHFGISEKTKPKRRAYRLTAATQFKEEAEDERLKRPKSCQIWFGWASSDLTLNVDNWKGDVRLVEQFIFLVVTNLYRGHRPFPMSCDAGKSIREPAPRNAHREAREMRIWGRGQESERSVAARRLLDQARLCGDHLFLQRNQILK